MLYQAELHPEIRGFACLKAAKRPDERAGSVLKARRAFNGRGSASLYFSRACANRNLGGCYLEWEATQRPGLEITSIAIAGSTRKFLAHRTR